MPIRQNSGLLLPSATFPFITFFIFEQELMTQLREDFRKLT